MFSNRHLAAGIESIVSIWISITFRGSLGYIFTDNIYQLVEQKKEQQQTHASCPHSNATANKACDKFIKIQKQ